MYKKTVVIAAFVAQLSISGFAQHALPTELVLATRGELERTYLPHEVNLQSGPLWLALGSVLIAARLPGGAAFAYGCEAPAQTIVSIPSTYSMASAFDVLTAVYTTHGWAVRDGVVNFLPKQNFPAILDSPIEALAWDTNETASRSVGRVFELSAIKRRFAELGVAAESFVGGLQQAPRLDVPRPKGREWKIENVTLLTALNRISASYGDVRWAYEERTCGSKTYRFWEEQ